MTAFPLSFLVGYHMTWLSPVLPALKIAFNETYKNRYGEYLTEDTWTTLLTLSSSSMIVGAFLSGPFGKVMLRFISTKHLVQLCHVMNLIAVAITALIGGLTWSYESFMMGRLLAGLASGLAYVTIPVTLAETSARKTQAFWQSMFGVSVALSAVVAVSLSHPKVLGSLYRWPIAISMISIPSVAYLVASVRISETPYYLTRNGHKEEAIALLQRLRKDKDSHSMEQELDRIQNEIDLAKKQLGIGQIIKTSQYRNQLFAVFALLANMSLTGITNMFLYMDLIFTDAGVKPEVAPFATIGVFFLQFVVTCFGPKLVMKFGGWKTNVTASSIIIFTHVLFTISQAAKHLAPTSMPYLAIVAVALFLVVWSVGTQLATFALISEITIEPTRATCLSYGTMVLWFSSWICGFLPPYFQLSLKAYRMVPWLVCTIFFLIYTIVFVPETKDKTIEEIQAKFHGKGDKVDNANVPLKTVQM
ncbi:unnamed protein product [Clavelina lepadiformis]